MPMVLMHPSNSLPGIVPASPGQASTTRKSRHMPKPTSKEIPASLELSASLDIEAADDGDNKTPTITMVANSGVPMRLAGHFDPVVIDMTGAKFDKSKTPILMDHDVSKRLGYTTEQTVEANRIIAKGVVMSSMGIAQGVVADARNGFPFQVSVGADIIKGYYVDEGETATVNGKDHKGPLVVASRTRIREISVTVLGADSKTSATITAMQRNNAMPFEDYVASLGFKAADLTDDQTAKLKAQWEKINATPAPSPQNSSTGEGVNTPAPQQPAPSTPDTLTASREQAATEELRQDTIRATASRYSDLTGEIDVDGKKTTLVEIKANAIRDGWDPDKLELILLRASRDADTPIDGAPAFRIAQQARDLDDTVISCAIVKQSGVMPADKINAASGERWGYEHSYTPQVLEASDNPQLRNVSLHQIMDLIHIRAYGHPYSGNRKSDDFINACRQGLLKIQAASGFTTHGATNIFDDAANKLLLAGYQSVGTTWQEWCAVTSVSDFKTSNMYRLTHKGGYQQVGADGQLKHGGMVDSKYTVAADTYGKIIGLTRKELINDDLGAFNSIMSGLGIEGAKSLEEAAYVVLLGQVGTMWSAGNKNLSTGAGSDLTIAGLNAANQKFEDQVDADTAPIMIEPDRILVGTQDRVYAGQLYNDTNIREGLGSSQSREQFTNNPHTSAYRPIVSGYLNNSTIKQRVASIGSDIPNQDANQWFMFGNPANPQGASFNAAFLNGNRTPILQSDDASFNVLGTQWRAFHDWGFGTGDPKLSVRSAGA